MCGICGAITRPNPNIIKSLLISNEKRGDKSTGIAYRIGEQTTVFKAVMKSTLFVDKIDNEKINSSNLVIGHTRMPSVGTLSKKNAHPFKYNEVVGVHNGTLWNHTDFKYSGDVDSQAIFHLLSVHKNRYTEVFPLLSGSMAVAWVYNGDPNLYLMRHISPMHIVKTNTSLYFNSEELPLMAAIAAAGEIGKVEEVEEDMVYVVNPDLEITKVKVSVKSYYSTPTNESYSEEERGYSLAPKSDYSFPQIPATIGSGRDAESNNLVDEHWQNRNGVVRRVQASRTAPLKYNRTRASLWSMKQILEKYKLFKPDGRIYSKIIKKKARKDLTELLGTEGYNLIKEVKSVNELARILNSSFGCNVCGYSSHNTFRFCSKNAFVYCLPCSANNSWIKENSDIINCN